MSFKSSHSLIDRKSETQLVLTKYPDRIPIICEKSSSASTDLPNLDKKKYLVPIDLTIGQFVYIIRKRLKLPPEQAIFLFINGMIPPTSSFITEVYHYAKDEDGFLYIIYAFENTFG
jgi:GABA(A) receptor-associated protein